MANCCLTITKFSPLFLITDGVTGLKELAFLRDLAEQNSGKYGIQDRTALPVVKGSMMVLNQLSNLETTVGRFYTNLPNRMIDEAVFSLPFSDEMGDGKCHKDVLLWKRKGRSRQKGAPLLLQPHKDVCLPPNLQHAVTRKPSAASSLLQPQRM